MKKILILTRNVSKFREYQRFFEGTEYQLVSLNDMNDSDYHMIYNSPKYKGVATYNALRAARIYRLPVIAEVFGLEIKSLKGWPGIETYKLFEMYKQQLVEKLIFDNLDPKGDDERDCEYVSGFAFALPTVDGKLVCSTVTKMSGRITKEIKQGSYGFGLDTVFYSTKYRLTLNRVENGKKDAISHRFEALRELLPEIDSALYEYPL